MINNKIWGVVYTLFLKIRYGKRLKIKGFIFPEGNIGVLIERGASVDIKGNITIRGLSKIIVRKGGHLTIGEGCFFNRFCSVVCRDRINIGNNVLMGEGVKIYDNDHAIVNGNVKKDIFQCDPIVIEDKVWVGNNVNILRNSWIKEGVIIGAMSLVKSQTETKAIYCGIPARKIKNIS